MFAWPTSFCPPLSRTLENVLSKFFVIKLITRVSSAQNGFAPKKSLVTQPTVFINEVLAASDSGNFTPANFNFLRAVSSVPCSLLYLVKTYQTTMTAQYFCMLTIPTLVTQNYDNFIQQISLFEGWSRKSHLKIHRFKGKTLVFNSEANDRLSLLCEIVPSIKSLGVVFS